MVLFGALGLFQAALLPGLALLTLWPSRDAERLCVPEILVFAFGLSLAFNYTAVLLLTAAGVNVPAAHFLLVLAGAAALGRAALTRRAWFRDRLLPVIALCLAGVVLLVGVYLVRAKGECIFRGADELFSWNAWALEWAGNAFPTNTRHYPQLLPAAWSVIYQLLPRPVDFFAKALMPLFTLGIAATFLAFWRLERRPGPLVALPVALFLVYSCGWRGSVLVMGLADVPSAFMGLLTYYAWSKWRAEPDRGLHLLLAGVFAGAAIVTKQGGLALLPFFLLAFGGDVVSALARRGARLSAWLPFWVSVVALGLPWYLYAEHQIAKGRNHYDAAEKWLVNDGTTFFAPERSVLGRLDSAFDLLAGAVGGHAVVVALAALCAWSLRRRGHRLIVLLMGFVYALIWAAFLSYDLRNLLPATPFLALGAGGPLGEGLARLLGRIPARLRDAGVAVAAALTPSPRAITGAGLLVAVLGAAALTATRSEAKIIDSLERLRAARIGDSAGLNRELYAWFDGRSAEDRRKIASYYPFLQRLPRLSERYAHFDLRRDGALQAALADPAVGYVLLVFNLHWRTFISDANMRAIEEELRAGTLESVFEIPEGRLLRVKGARP